MRRLEANRAILKELSDIVEQFPEWRFHQLLVNIGVEVPGVDKFYEESEKTLAEIRDGVVQ